MLQDSFEDRARFFMWTRLIDGYPKIKKQDRMEAKESFCEQWGYTNPKDMVPHMEDWDNARKYDMAEFGKKVMELKMEIKDYDLNSPVVVQPFVNIDDVTRSFSLGPLFEKSEATVTWTGTAEAFDALTAPNKKENNMGYNEMTINDGTSDQREHLSRRVTSAYHTFYGSLGEKFYKYDDPSPKTLEDITKRLAAGSYRIKKDLFNADGRLNHWNVNEAIEWRTKDFDKEGFKAAEKLLDAAYTKAKDDVAILPPVDGLAALRAFEAMTF